MEFQENTLYHIFNQGNNKRTIFLEDDNYEYFIWKMEEYLLPFGDLIAYCLMPNHYHWLFFVKKNKLNKTEYYKHVNEIEFNRRKLKYGAKAMKPQKKIYNSDSYISINEAIGIIQGTYSRALNNRKGWSGSLFRKNYKAKDGWIDEFVTLKNKSGKINYKFLRSNDYAFICLNYIHKNPVKAQLVEKEEDWKYSSAKDYLDNKSNSICNLQLGRNILKYL